MTKMRKTLSAEGLINTIRNKFNQVKEKRQFSSKQQISLTDCLMSCFAVFSLKWPSLLLYDKEKRDPCVQNNFASLYKIKNPPSDTYMRERLDEINPNELRSSYKAVFSSLQRGKALEQFQFLDGYYLISTL